MAVVQGWAKIVHRCKQTSSKIVSTGFGGHDLLGPPTYMDITLQRDVTPQHSEQLRVVFNSVEEVRQVRDACTAFLERQTPILRRAS